ncbi:MAG: hypothetical protein JWM16_2943 [Verrucomicrobiales bacterium]|nr:hypothetical protein [Verrucomicrobiales bacterium]
MNFCNGMMFGSMETSIASLKEKRVRQVLGFLCAIALSLGFGTPARATSIPWGDPILSHSWEQMWTASLDGGFDGLKASILLPPVATFENPGFDFDSSSGWSGTSATRLASGYGSLTTSLEFKIHFNNLPTDYTDANPLGVLFNYYRGADLVQQEYWIYNGKEWVDPPAPSVPDGGTTVLLLGVSAMGLGWARKKLA